jgi:hypothetical protein
MSYAGAWAHACCVVVGIGAGLAILEWSPLAAGLAFALVSGCAAVVVVLLDVAREPAQTESAGHGPGAVASRSLLAGTGSVALVAVVTASPPVALLLVLLAGLSCPPVVRLARRRRARSRPTPAARRQARLEPLGRFSPVTTDGVVRRLSDPELCRLWRRTFWQLTSLPRPEAVLATVLLRQALLDELARRNPDAVHAWLESGGRASGGPEKFWATRHRHGDADTAS